MALGDLLPQSALHTRRSSVILSQSVWPFTTPLTWSAPTAARLKVTGQGLSAGVLLSVIGTLNGVGQLETVAVPLGQPQVAISTKRWSTVTNIASVDTPTGTIVVEGIEQGGMPLLTPQTITAALPVRLRESAQRQTSQEPGTVQDEIWLCYTEKDVLRPFDLLAVDQVQYVVENIYRVHNAAAFHHIKARLRRLPSPV